MSNIGIKRFYFRRADGKQVTRFDKYVLDEHVFLLETGVPSTFGVLNPNIIYLEVDSSYCSGIGQRVRQRGYELIAK